MRIEAAPSPEEGLPGEVIRSREHPLLKAVRKLASGGGARHAGQVWVEGEHLGLAMAARGLKATLALVAEPAWQQPRWRALAQQQAARQRVVSQACMAGLSSLPSPPPIGFLLELPQAGPIDSCAPTVVLDRLQDPGNAGSILRSAAAFGFHQVLALKGTVALWSPKVLRGGMGAHFGLSLHEGLGPQVLAQLRLPRLATALEAGEPLPGAALPWPCAWLLGHEGQGLDAELLAQADRRLRIEQPGGEESLNVGAAAAICFYESARQRPRRG